MKAISLFCLILTAACQKDRIETRRVAKENAAAPIGSAPAAARGVRWTVPAGWTQLPASEMRVATFRLPSGAGKAEVTVVALPGDVGGELANVNRWRGQIALPPMAQDQLAPNRAVWRSKLGPVSVYDFTGTGTPKSRLCAGMVFVDGTTWFFKLMGDDKAVGSAKPNFRKLLEGLTRDDG